MLVLAVGLSAQDKPNFSGTWVLDEAKTAAARKPGPATGAGGGVALPIGRIVITQTPASLTVEREALGKVIRYSFTIDGPESVNKSGAVTMTTRTRWDGATLVTEGTQSQVTSQGYAAWKYRQTFATDTQGALVLETTFTAADGTQTVGIQVFKRASNGGTPSPEAGYDPGSSPRRSAGGNI
jgi:hypothetical protein